jgi:serine/threonine-protein kinase
MWRDRLDDAERCRAREDAAFALRMVRRLDDGRLSAYVAGDGSLELTSEPPGAEVVIARFEDRHGVLRPEAPRRLGATPLARIQLAMGSYLCTLTLPGCSDVHYPVHVTRNRAWTGRVRMRSRDEIGDEFAYVPGGPFVYGEGVETRIAELPDFAIARRPVTLADWAEFLSAVEQEDGPDAARKLVPHVRGDGDYMERRSDGRWVPLQINCEGAARERCLRTHGPDFEIRLPVAGVSWHHAVAWCEWKTRTTGREWRLPTEEEREKAARGVDGRRFPWGDLQNATLGRCRDSRDEVAQPEPVGSFPHATSVYGVVDAAGNSFDWTDSWFDARAATRAIRGGSWSFPPEYLRCAFRYSARPESQLANNGFRPARSFAN